MYAGRDEYSDLHDLESLNKALIPLDIKIELLRHNPEIDKVLQAILFPKWEAIAIELPTFIINIPKK